MVQTQLIPVINNTERMSALSMAAEDSKPAPNATPSPIRPIQDALGTIFPTVEQDARQQQARGIMEDAIAGVSDQVLGAQITELQYLIDAFMDDFERSVFEGKTLTQLIRG